MKKYVLYTVLTALFLCVCATGSYAAEAAVVLTVKSGAWVQRGAEKITLSPKDSVHINDTLVTDDTGMMQVIFPDDTTISLGPDTQVSVTDFVFDQPGNTPSFSASMARGAARFVTGKVVEQNRDGFSVATPQATVGIRGTTFAVNVSDKGITSVIGLKITSGFPISVMNRETGAISTIQVSGMAVDASASGNASYQTPPGQFSQSSSAVNGSVVATTTTSDTASSEAATTAVMGAASAATGSVSAGVDSNSSLASSTSGGTTASNATTLVSAAAASSGGVSGALASMLQGNAPAAAMELANSAGDPLPTTLGGAVAAPPVNHSNTTAVYSGDLRNAPLGSGGGINGNFSFNVTLNAGSGQISNGQMGITSGYGNGLQAQQNGGGAVSGGAFTIPMDVINRGTLGSIVNQGVGSNNASMNGNFGPSDTVTGSWSVLTTGGTEIFAGGPMGFNGAKQ